MSGGTFNYGYLDLERYIGKMADSQLNGMIKDLVEVLHDIEWWTDGDIDEEEYRKTVTEFKKKWFKQKDADIKAYIEEQFEQKKEELLKELEYLKK